MREQIFKCDVCGKVKGEVNHWFSLCRKTRYFQVFEFGPDSDAHACGQTCVVRFLSTWLDSATQPQHPEELRS